jgi:flagellum-specific ATP synthase
MLGTGTAPNRWHQLFTRQQEFLGARRTSLKCGKLIRVNGMMLEVAGLQAPLGAIVDIDKVEGEVVGFNQDRLYVMPIEDTVGLGQGARVKLREAALLAPTLNRAGHTGRRATDLMRHLPLGLGLLGRVVDARGVPLDGKGALEQVERQPIHRRTINAMQRQPVREPLDTGVRAINSLLSVGLGQRLGLFAGPGVGKSVLMGMMARYTSADVTVVGLVGERGREVKEFIEDILGESGLARSVVVAAPADSSPILRLQGASYATAIAEYYRDQGLNVLLLMDSLTRYAMAAREIALAVGEAPATKGYPASVFARLPQLVERTGNGINGVGSITAIYTVLAEGDDQNDPIADAARSFLDGHFVLSRTLADSGHYPAIDVEQSISRVMSAVTTAREQQLARKFRELWSGYQNSRDLIMVGAYVAGSDLRTDQAIQLYPQMQQFLQQSVSEPASWQRSQASLEALVGPLLESEVR